MDLKKNTSPFSIFLHTLQISAWPHLVDGKSEVQESVLKIKSRVIPREILVNAASSPPHRHLYISSY